jgi:hypothetical protein
MTRTVLQKHAQGNREAYVERIEAHGVTGYRVRCYSQHQGRTYKDANLWYSTLTQAEDTALDHVEGGI